VDGRQILAARDGAWDIGRRLAVISEEFRQRFEASTGSTVPW
jgi:hypothetical protein